MFRKLSNLQRQQGHYRLAQASSDVAGSRAQVFNGQVDTFDDRLGLSYNSRAHL